MSWVMRGCAARIGAWFLLAGILAGTILPKSAFATEFSVLDGRTVRFIIGTAAGGGNDTLGRLLAKAMGRVVPKTSFRVQNLEGAAGGVAIAALQGDQGNLISLAFTTNGVVYVQLIEDKPAFDIAKLNWIGSVGNNQRMLGMRAALGAPELATLKTLGHQPILPAAGNVGNMSSTDPLIINALVGLNLKVVPGVADGQITALLMAGDADVTMGSYGSLKPLIDSGEIKPVLRYSKEGYPPLFDAVPTLEEVALPGPYRDLIPMMEALSTNGRLLMAAPTTKPEVVEALQHAFDAAILDPEYIRSMEKLGYVATGVGGVTLKKRIATLLNSDETLRGLLKSAIACGLQISDGGVMTCP